MLETVDGGINEHLRIHFNFKNITFQCLYSRKRKSSEDNERSVDGGINEHLRIHLNFKNITFQCLYSRKRKSSEDNERFARYNVVLKSQRFYLPSIDFGCGREALESEIFEMKKRKKKKTFIKQTLQCYGCDI